MNATFPEVQSTRKSTGRDPRTVEIAPRADGTFGALSSNGRDIYCVRRVGRGFTCQCRGFASRQTCCHILAAATCFGECWWSCSRAGVAIYWNGFDQAWFSLCPACTAGEVRS